jgi:hypothetical protein
MSSNARDLRSTPAVNLPEEKELECKRRQLEAVEAELVEWELDLTTLRSELNAFERRYFSTVGRRYAELDLLEARIAEHGARHRPADEAAQRQAESTRARARQSAEAFEESDRDQESKATKFEPTDELKALYRKGARQLHPDMASNDEDRARRQKAMAQFNEAYEQCDEARMQRILDEWRADPSNVEGEGAGAELVRVIRTIAKVRQRLTQVTEEIEELRRSELYSLKVQVDEAAMAGRDLLSEMADDLSDQIEDAKARLQSIQRNERVR